MSPLEFLANSRLGARAPSAKPAQAQGRYSASMPGQRLPVSEQRLTRLTRACCPEASAPKGQGCQPQSSCGCPSCQASRARQGSMPMSFPSPGNMMLPNITINVQSGNREGSEYADNSDRSSRYSSDFRQSNDPTYAPASSENNPAYYSYERGDESHSFSRSDQGAPMLVYGGRPEIPQERPQARYEAPAARPPVIASPQAAEEARRQALRLRAIPPERVAERFYKEFP